MCSKGFKKLAMLQVLPTQQTALIAGLENIPQRKVTFYPHIHAEFCPMDIHKMI